MEFLFELIIEGLIDASGKPKIPLVIRLLLFTIVVAIPTSIGVLAGFSAMKATGIVGAIICWLIAAGCILLWLFGCYKIIQTRKGNLIK